MAKMSCLSSRPRRRSAALLALLLITGSPLAEVAARAAPPAASTSFDIHTAPTPADWRYFMRASEKDREKLWTTHESLGSKLGDWSWGWRLGWVRTCDGSERPFCRGIYQAALSDRALVVRAEAATRLGRRLEGSGNQSVLDLLAHSYAGSRNLRHGQPMYIQQRILFAIHRIGGPYAADLGLRLAASHPETKKYWRKLASPQG